MSRFLTLSIAVLVLGTLAPSTTFAETTINSTDLLLQQELRQEQIKDTTGRVGAQLDVIIDEYERNGLSGDDVSVLKAIRSVLGDLTQEEIRKVITLLQSARNTTDPGESSENTLNAYAGQKSIIVQLRHLMLEYERQQILREIARRFRDLGRRQGVNMSETVALYKATLGRDARRSKESHRISLQLQATEQSTIQTETSILLKKLYDVVGKMDGLPAEKPRAAVVRAKESELGTIVANATEDLKESRLTSAAGNEQRARALFVELSRLLRPDRDAMTTLKEALKELEKTMVKQEVLVEETKQLAAAKKDEDLRDEIEKRQMQVVDETAMISEDVAELAPVAASELKESIDQLQQARSKLSANVSSKDRNEAGDAPAVAKQKEALKKMEAAKVTLVKKITEAEEASDESDDKISKLKKLLAEVQELSQKQEDAKTAANLVSDAKSDQLPKHAAHQQTLKALTQDAHAKAIPLAKQAAESLAEASKQMSKAADTLAQKLTAPRAQQAAADALKRAESELAQEVATLEKAEEQMAKLDALGKKVSELIQEQQKVQLQTAKAAQTPDAEGKRQALAQAAPQAKLAGQTEAAAQEAAQSAPQAARNLAAASNDMGNAKKELQKPDAAVARKEQGRALENLLTAKQNIDQKKQELAKALGKPEANKPDLLAQASEQVSAAQLLVNKAVSDLERPATLSDLVKAEQEKLAALVAEKAAADPDSALLLAAKEATKKAAAKLESQDVVAAIGEMAKAEKSLLAAAKSESAASGKPPAKPGDATTPAGKAAPTGKSPASPASDAGKPATASKPSDANAAAKPSAAQLAKEQGDLAAIANQLAKTEPQAAAEPLDTANEMISPLTSGAISMLPMDAQLSLRAAQQALTEASAKASSGDASPAQDSAQAAQDSLNKAAAALALAQKGLGNNSEQQMAKGEGGKGESEQKGKGDAKGPGKSAPKSDSKDGQGNGDKGNFTGEGGADGRLRKVADRNTFIGLPARERNAILQSLGESYPEEFGPLVEQYLKNLSDQASRGSR
jgi:hypothetical protein